MPIYNGSLYRSTLSVPTSSVIGNVLNGEIPASDAYRGLRIQAGHEREPG